MRDGCTLCSDLVRSRRRIVWPDILAPDPKVLVVAEAPGVEEDKEGRPLVGMSGQEARHSLSINGILGFGVCLTNIVQCWPEGNRDPTSDEISNCTRAHLVDLLEELQPEWIITMGAISTRYFLGNVTMEMVHGIPHSVNWGKGTIIIPVYHPAAGFHSPETMIHYQSDMRVAGDVIKGKIKPHPPNDEYEGGEHYEVVNKGGMQPYLEYSDVVAIDTETKQGEPWCLSVSVSPGTALVAIADQRPSLNALNEVVNYRHTTTVVHNAPFDLPVLAKMGIHPAKIADTMVMAYLLQDEPQGLKPLAKRHLGMDMSSYTEMVEEATHTKALAYLERVLEWDWPDPEPVLEWKKGEPHVRQPQNVEKKVKRVLADIEAGKDINPYDRWRKMEDVGDQEEILGPLTEGDLGDIPFEEAVRYSARDADATIRLYPILWGRIEAAGLVETFERDMRAMPMVVDMMENGMPVDVEAFAVLSQYFQGRMDEIQDSIQMKVGRLMGNDRINPASYPQMSILIYDRLALDVKGGRHKSKSGAAEKSTANDILQRYVDLHPVVQEVIDWREYAKLKNTYADAIPKLVGGDGRVRSTLRITRVTTGRLSSSKPNLMAQPVRSSEGRKVRDCYLAKDGYVFVEGDYSQVEMRVAASEAKDERMMRIFWEGADIHSQTASDMFGVPLGNLDEMKHRYPAKRIGFGILNLITAKGLHRELIVGGAKGWTVADCEGMIHAWFDIYPGIAAYMKANGEHAKRYGYVVDMWGRRRFIPGIKTVNRWARIEAERQAGNAPIQMGAQGVIKEAMGLLQPICRELGIKPLIQIHDSLLFEAPEDRAKAVIPILKSVMEEVAPDDFIVPLPVDFKIGRRWGSMEKD